MIPSSRKIETVFFFLLVIGASITAFLILKPYASPLFIALIFSLVFRPLYEAVLKKSHRANLASLITLCILFLVILIPLTVFGFFIFDDARNLYFKERGEAPILETLDRLVLPLEQRVQAFFPNAQITPSAYLEEALGFLVGNLGSVFSRAVEIVFKFFIMLLALFYLFRDGKNLRTHVVRLSPLANEYDERILTRLEEAISSVVKGRLLIVVIQGILAAVTFSFFSIPNPVLWGAITLLSALVPAVGVALVFVPLTLFTFFAVGGFSAGGLLLVGVGIGMIDNLLGPILFERGLRMHPLMILLSVLGGILLFGPIGFLAGPITLSLLFALLDIYPLLFERKEISNP